MQEQQSDWIKEQRVQQHEEAFKATLEEMTKEYSSQRGMDPEQIAHAIEQIQSLLVPGKRLSELMNLENQMKRDLLRTYSPNRSIVSSHLKEQLGDLVQHRLVWQDAECNAEEQKAAMGQIVSELELRLTVSSRVNRTPGDVTNPPDVEQIRNNMPTKFSEKPALLEGVLNVMADPVTAVLDDLYPIRDDFTGADSDG